MQRVLRQDHYPTPTDDAHPHTARIYQIATASKPRNRVPRAEEFQDRPIDMSTARIDLCRLFVALLGLSLYLGLPAAGLVYLGLQLVS